MSFGTGLGDRRAAATARWPRTSRSTRSSANFTKILGTAHTAQGRDRRPPRATTCACRATTTGRARSTSTPSARIGPTGGGLGLATFLLGDVTVYQRYVSPSTDARERQWRTSSTLQDTWRAEQQVDASTTASGSRTSCPETVNEAGNGGWLDARCASGSQPCVPEGSGQILIGGVGDVDLDGNIQNTINWRRASASPTSSTTRPSSAPATAAATTSASSARPSATRDAEPAGAVDPGDQRPRQLRVRLQPGAGPAAADVRELLDRPLPAAERRQLLSCRTQRRLRLRGPTTGTSRCSASSRPTRRSSWRYVGNNGSHVHGRRRPRRELQPADARGLPRRPARPAAAVLQRPRTAGTARLGFRDCATSTTRQQLQLDADQVRQEHEQRLLAAGSPTPWAKASNHGDSDYFWIDRELNYGTPGWHRTHQVVLAGDVRAALRPRRASCWAAGSSTGTSSSRAVNPSDIDYRNAGQDRDTGPNRPDVIGDPTSAAATAAPSPCFNATPIGSAGSAFGRPAVGTFGNMERDSYTGPGWWNVDASLFKRFAFGRRALELRFEVQNVFNHVNLGNPDGGIGVPGTTTPTPA